MRRFNSYRIKPGDNIADPAVWNPKFEDIDLRMHSVEQAADEFRELGAAEVVRLGLERVNEQINPLVVEAQKQLASIPSLFRATSPTEMTVGTGQMTFVIDEVYRGTFVAAEYLSVQAVDDSSAVMSGKLVSFDRETGDLVLDVEVAQGAGTFDAWTFFVSGRVGPEGPEGPEGPPGTMQNASEVPLDAVPNLVATDVQAAIAELRNTSAWSIARVTGLQAALDAKAPSFHSHTMDQVSGLQTALSGKASTGHLHDSRYGRTDAKATFQRSAGHPLATLAYAASMNWDVDAKPVAVLTMTGNATLNTFINATAGFFYTLVVKMDGTGGHTLSFGDGFRFPGGGAPDLATAADAISILTFVYDGAHMLGVAAKEFA